VFKDRKSQQQTLSIRVSEEVRAFLDRARKQFSDTRGSSVSISDVAKVLLETAIESRLDDRLETTDLLSNPTAALFGIRKKWEDNQQLTRAEWIVLGQYVQSGCDKPSSDPELPTRESFAQLLEALLAIRELRHHHIPELDHYYVTNLSGSTEQGDRILTGGPEAAEIVPAGMRRMIQDLRNVPGAARYPFIGRNVYVALRDERLESVDSLNRALRPFLPVLYRIAARGHWLVEHQPIRQKRNSREPLGVFPPIVPPVDGDNLRISSSINDDGELHMLLSLKSRKLLYPLGPFPQIREFHSMVTTLVRGKTWNGHYFYAYTDRSPGASSLKGLTPNTFFFREYGKGVQIEFSGEEWHALRNAFEQVMSLAELQPALNELALAYGDV
jgi:hypothetical protein